MTPVPLVFPRQETTANLMGAVQRGKKGITGTYNVLGKVTSSVAGIVGVKEVVESGFDNVKKAVGKTGLMEGLIDPFGRLNLLGQLHDQWTHGSKQTERTYLIRSLQQIASQKSLRFTFLSGGIGCCAAGLLHDPDHPRDNKTMYQLISAPVVDAPLQPYLARLFNHRRDSRLYVPREGKPAKDPTASTDTKEDMIELFNTGTWPGQAGNENRVLMPRRNYLALVAYDATAATAPVTQSGASVNGSIADPLAKVNLAADFFVQGEGSQATMKYGPVVVPNLEMWS
ncbi:hypothetical protein KEM55_003165 [Ascosphaera atra]|nr:hypothetical protein KEM55_003165 [Ascosphaera atra]